MLMGDRCRIITVHCSVPADPLGHGWIQELKPSRLNSLFHHSVTFDHERSWQRRCFARIRPPPDHKRVEDRKKGGVPDDDCSSHWLLITTMAAEGMVEFAAPTARQRGRPHAG